MAMGGQATVPLWLTPHTFLPRKVSRNGSARYDNRCNSCGSAKGTFLISTWHDVLRPGGSSTLGLLTVPPLSRGKGHVHEGIHSLGSWSFCIPHRITIFSFFALR